MAQIRFPLLFSTGGSCEPDEQHPTGASAEYGACIYDPGDDTYEYCGGYIQTDQLDLIALGGTKKQIAGQSELLPCIAARTV